MQGATRELLSDEVRNVQALNALFVYASIQNIEAILREPLLRERP
jgi:hypothetical protein